MMNKNDGILQHDEFSQLLVKQQNLLLELSYNVKKVFVTGAGGFLGSYICKMLRLADIEVVGFSRNKHDHLAKLGVDFIRGDIAHYNDLYHAMLGCDMVFHVASKAGVWGDEKSYFDTNVTGTKNVIKACKVLKIRRMIYTSTPSVTFSGVDEKGIDETTPYSDHFLNHYAKTKAIAESYVLKSNSKEFKTVALRPHLIWGPNDPNLIPRIIARAKRKKLKLVGATDKLVDTTYIDNAVYAHFLAALELCKYHSKCSGNAYFVSDDKPITMAKMINNILDCAHMPPVTKRINTSAAYFIGATLENVYSLFGIKKEPLMTRFVARQLSTSHYFNISKAKRDFDYSAIISRDEGMIELEKSLRK